VPAVGSAAAKQPLGPLAAVFDIRDADTRPRTHGETRSEVVNRLRLIVSSDLFIVCDE